jgi:hypothetical protein
MTETATIEKEGARQEHISGINALWSPEGVLMMTTAVSVDVAEFFFDLIPVVGLAISFVIDIFALLFFGAWMLFRSGAVRVPAKTGKRLVGAMKWAKKMRWLRPLLVIFEFIPVLVFESFTWWTILIYLELKHSS